MPHSPVSAPPSIVVIGHTSIDDIYRSDGTVSKGVVGGAALYAIRGASLWPSISIGLVTRRGDDVPDSELRSCASDAARIDWTGVSTQPGDSIRAAIYHYEDGSRKVEFADDSRVLPLTPRGIDIPAHMCGSSFVHVTPGDIDIQSEVVKTVQSHGSRVCLDTETHYLRNRSPEELQSLISFVDILMPSIEQMPYFVGDLTVQSPEWIESIYSLGPSVVVVKCGASGSIVLDCVSRTHWRIPAPTDLDVVDTTGAGDAFCGGFLAGLAASENPVEAAVWGTVSAWFVLESEGARASSTDSGRARNCRYYAIHEATEFGRNGSFK